MSIRLSCVVPGCKHTRGQRKGEKPITDGEEWVCGAHWKVVPPYIRRRCSTLRRKYRRLCGPLSYWEFPAGSNIRISGHKLSNMCAMAWKLAKRAAIERGIGIK